MNMTVFWLAAAGVFLVLEAITAALCSIWFAAGALAAMAAAVCGGAVWLQILLFVLVSALCFVLLYPRLKHLVARNRQATNADKVIGQTCVVTQRIDNIAGTGAVSVDGKIWTARAANGETVEPDALAKVERIEGVKLIVTPAAETAAIH